MATRVNVELHGIIEARKSVLPAPADDKWIATSTGSVFDAPVAVGNASARPGIGGGRWWWWRFSRGRPIRVGRIAITGRNRSCTPWGAAAHDETSARGRWIWGVGEPKHVTYFMSKTVRNWFTTVPASARPEINLDWYRRASRKWRKGSGRATTLSRLAMINDCDLRVGIRLVTVDGEAGKFLAR